ncbi:hypothetical protein MN116_005466 [Schistosoma mekongi]|uniref:Uncharacterized protein n=1 Tax=Schistosoma mekongi TaxID=38744 RepID=A0AAE1ZDN6_SCHME|nr:hypothetical protein MN116_005466 [Schistosoma mekongi]
MKGMFCNYYIPSSSNNNNNDNNNNNNTPELHHQQKKSKQQQQLSVNEVKISINVTNPRLNYSTALKNIDHHIKIITTTTTASPSLAYNTITTTTATVIDNYYPAHLKSIINLPGKSSDPLNRRVLVNFPTNHTLNENISSSNDCLTWHRRSDSVNRKTSNHLTNNDQFKSIQIKPSVVPFSHKQEIITMPDNNNNNNDRKPIDELTLRERRTQQQQQPYQPITQPPQSQQQFISTYSKDKSNTLNVNFKENKSDKVKLVDTRRTTPRQLKQHQSKRGHPLTSTTVSSLTETDKNYSLSSTNHSHLEKSITTSGNYHSSNEKSTSAQQHTNSSDLATSLIRTASLHLKSTLSRLKRSNSGHSDKPICKIVTTTTTVPTTPTTIHTTDLPSVKMTDDTALHHDSLPSEDNRSTELVTEINTNKNQLNKESNNNNSNLSSSSLSRCTKWSTRLGPPPPPCTDTCPKCTSFPTFCETNTVITTTSTRVIPSNIKNGKIDSALYSNITTTTTSGSNIGSSGSIFHLLPKCERNNKISLLPDDCADFGGFGRINFRTGSFMGRYPNYSRTNHQLQQPQRGQYFLNGNNSSSSIQQQQQHQSQSLSDYRPLYLFAQPHATSSSSGNTTQSTPSPSLSPITSTHGMLSSPTAYCEPCQQNSQPKVTYLGSQNKSVNLKTSSSSSVTMTGSTRSPRVNSIHNPQSLIIDNYHLSNSDEYSIPVHHEMLLSKSSSPSPSCVTPHPELDPILERLLLDVTSIDEYRTALHSHGSVTPPTSTNRQLLIQRMHTALGSSDPESISRSVEHMTNRSITDGQQNVLHNIWDLNKQINDLIQMEFNYKQKQ